MPPCFQFWNDDLLQVVDDLLAHHDDGQLLCQLDQATAVAALQIEEYLMTKTSR